MQQKLMLNYYLLIDLHLKELPIIKIIHQIKFGMVASELQFRKEKATSGMNHNLTLLCLG